MKHRRGLYIALLLPVTLALSWLGCQSVFPRPGTTQLAAPTPGGVAAGPIDPDWRVPAPGFAAPSLPSIADVVARVKPAVVAINVAVVSYDSLNQPTTQEGAGSGWVIDRKGIVVTNNHVVEGAQTVTVTLDNGRTVPATQVRTDPLTDLAVLTIDAPDLPAIPIGDSTGMRVGDWVIAIGNPLGLGISAKEGIVSRLGVSIAVAEGQVLHDLIETSAAINPGNSGGPLVNMAGQIIGITSAKIATVGVEGLGYAITLNSATPVIEALVTSGCITRPWLGIEYASVTPALADQFSFPVSSGAVVTKVVAGSVGERGGLRVGDLVVEFRGQPITSADGLRRILNDSQIGDTVGVVVYRGSSRANLRITLEESPPCQYQPLR